MFPTVLCFSLLTSLALADPTTGLMQLDPLCEPVEARYPAYPPGQPAESTQRMARKLIALHEKMNPLQVPYLSDRAAKLLAAKLPTTREVSERARLLLQLGLVQIQAGRPDSALNTFAELERFYAEQKMTPKDAERVALRLYKATAFLRMGELENCLATHNPDSCVFPLKPRAYHVLPRGSRGALVLLDEQLQAFPEDLSSRWLLNLAHMTLGDYPSEVPPCFLIPPECFASEFTLPQFSDQSQKFGLDTNNLAGGVVIEDFNQDGFYDVVISSWELRGQLRYFQNTGHGGFVERTSEAGLVGETAALNIQQTDYNNDGLPDLWLMRGAWLNKTGRLPKSLLRNNGDGTFTDVTEAVGLLSPHPGQTSCWFDYDGDGWLDVFIGHESTDPNDPDWCELYHNGHNGRFMECSETCGLHVAQFVKGVACADYDNDGRPDLYLSVKGGQNLLFHNDGPAEPKAPFGPAWKFTDVTARAGPITEPIQSFGTFFFDYDNDGWDDLFVAGYDLPGGVGEVAADYLGQPNRGAHCKLYHNQHDGTFADVSAALHLDRLCHAMGLNFGDIDNDGWLDFYAGTGDPDFRTLIPNRLFRNDGGQRFQDVTTVTGTGHLQKGHGVAIADLDGDGNQDIYVAMGGSYTGDAARNALFINPGGNAHHWLKLKLTGTTANRVALGARIQVSLQTPHGPRMLHRTVNSGGSFGSHPLQQEIGLGDATAILAVTIRWPGAAEPQTITGMELDHRYELKQGEPIAVPILPKQG